MLKQIYRYENTTKRNNLYRCITSNRHSTNTMLLLLLNNNYINYETERTERSCW